MNEIGNMAGKVIVRARGILAVRDALVANDVEDAYHQLCMLVDPYYQMAVRHGSPWALLEAMREKAPREPGDSA